MQSWLRESENIEKLSKCLGMSSVEKLLAQEALNKKAQSLNIAPVQSSALFVALASIFAAIRLGHLGIEVPCSITENGIYDLYPRLETLWKKVDEVELIDGLSFLFVEGFRLLKEHAALFEAKNVQGIWTLNSQYALEKEVALSLKALFKRTQVQPSKAFSFLEEQSFTKLHKKQQQAVELALKSSFMVMTGGPVTGKTHTISMMLRAIRPRRCLLLAPTGKAALQLSRRLNSDDFEHTKISITTLHRALGLTHRKKDPVPLDADCIILDEASMVDLYLMRLFLRALSPDSKVILVGDPKQLPSVESGTLFADIVTHLKENCSESLVHLSHVFRTEDKKIIDFHTALENGENNFIEKVESGFASNLLDQLKGIYYAMDTDIENLLSAYFEFARIQLGWSLLEARSFWESIRLLCPLRRGPYGSYAINQELLQRALSGKKEITAPVIVTKTKGAFVNGQLGVATFEEGSSKATSALFEGDPIVYRDEELPDLELAFCLTVHKTQGSEFDRVFLAYPEGSENFGREALYTAVTRAKKQVVLWGKKETFHLAIGQKIRRVGQIKALLSDES